MNLFADFIKSYDVKKIKFLMVGLINTFFGYSVYALFIWMGYAAFKALFIATVLGGVFNYFSFGMLVFNAQNSLRVWSKFIVTYMTVYALNAIVLSVLIANMGLNAYLAQAMCLLPSVMISWLLMNYWVYKKR